MMAEAANAMDTRPHERKARLCRSLKFCKPPLSLQSYCTARPRPSTNMMREVCSLQSGTKWRAPFRRLQRCSAPPLDLTPSEQVAGVQGLNEVELTANGTALSHLCISQSVALEQSKSLRAPHFRWCWQSGCSIPKLEVIAQHNTSSQYNQISNLLRPFASRVNWQAMVRSSKLRATGSRRPRLSFISASAV